MPSLFIFLRGTDHKSEWVKYLLLSLLLFYHCITCGVPQGSILGPLLFLIYVNDMSQAVKSNLFLYADDSCLAFLGKDVIEIEKQLHRLITKTYK